MLRRSVLENEGISLGEENYLRQDDFSVKIFFNDINKIHFSNWFFLDITTSKRFHFDSQKQNYFYKPGFRVKIKVN